MLLKANSGPNRLCFACGKYKPVSVYSKKQLKKWIKRRCPDCIMNNKAVQRPNHWFYPPNIETQQDKFSKPFWTSLEFAPTYDHDSYICNSNCVALNYEEFIFVTSNTNKAFQIYKFNTNTNKWSVFMDLSALTVDILSTYIYGSTIAIDQNKQILYCYNCAPGLFIIDLKTKEWSILDNTPSTYCAHDPLLIFANNKLYLHAGVGIISHYVLNNTNKTFEKISDLDRLIPDCGRACVYRSNTNQILLYGGCNGDCSHKVFPGAWIYAIDDNIWSKYNIDQLPTNNFGYVLTFNQKYMILFSGYKKEHGDNTKDIYVWDIDTMKVQKSKICCPFYQSIKMQCVITSDRAKALIMAFGYIRDCCKQNSKLVLLNQDIVKLIALWCVYESIHLFSCKSKMHYKIDVNDIFNNICN
eukprot:429809_1